MVLDDERAVLYDAGRPRPEPMPTGLVVKNGSNIRF